MSIHTTIVTGYFTIPSKFSDKQYWDWIVNFLSLNCHMVIYTDSINYDKIKASRSEHNTKIYLRELKDFYVYKYINYWNYCKTIDPEKYHTPELYMIWAEKSFMVLDTVQNNPFNSDYFMWCDMGSIRTKSMLQDIISFPSLNNIQKLISKDKIFLSVIDPFKQDEYVLDKDGISTKLIDKNKSRIQGGFMAGYKSVWKEWAELYEKELQLFIKTDTFGGKDQYIMNNIYISKKNESFIHLHQTKSKFLINNKERNVDVWFSFLYIFADL